MERLKKALLPLLFAGVLYTAFFGGEYSVLDLRSARAQVVTEGVELERLRHEIDSLRAWADSLESDSATIERIARERFGMIGQRETLYRFVPADALQGRAEGPAR